MTIDLNPGMSEDDYYASKDAQVAAAAPVPSLRELATEEEPAPEAGLPGQSIRVVLEDGTDFTVRTTNKDYIRWDKTPPARRAGVKQFQDAPFLFATFLAWAAARRTEVTSLTFDQFLDAADVVERQSSDEVPPTR